MTSLGKKIEDDQKVNVSHLQLILSGHDNNASCTEGSFAYFFWEAVRAKKVSFYKYFQQQLL